MILYKGIIIKMEKNMLKSKKAIIIAIIVVIIVVCLGIFGIKK